MTALSNTWKILTGVSRQDDNTTRLTLTDIGLSLTGEKFEVTGVGSTEGDLYEDLQFTATRVDDDNVDIDWLEHGYIAPPDDWSFGGMVRVYDAPIGCPESARYYFNPNEISSLISTADNNQDGSVNTDAKGNLLNSNRNGVHTMYGGVDHTLTATLPDSSLVETIILLDLVCDLATKVRIRGDGDNPVDLIYNAIEPRYTLDERPKLSYGKVTIEGHNLDDLVPHFVRNVPAMTPGTVQIDLIGSIADISVSELIICSFYTPRLDRSMDRESIKSLTIDADMTQRGRGINRLYKGVQGDISHVLSFLEYYDQGYIELMIKSRRTVVFDPYPLARYKRWANMTAGFLTSAMPMSNQSTGGRVELRLLDTKLHPGLQDGN